MGKGKSENKTFTPYQQHVRECFRDAYNFFDKHQQARTDKDWDAIVDDVALYKEKFTLRLISCVIDELEREYLQQQDKEQQ